MSAASTLVQILDAVLHPVFWKDCRGVYLGCNEAFARVVGLATPAEIVGRTDFDLPLSRAEAEGYRADDRAVIESGQPRRHIVEPLRQADGTCLWINTTKLPLWAADGRVCGVVGFFEDITERRRAEETVKQERHFSESAMEAMPGVFFMLDERGRLLKWNRNVETLTGYTTAEIAGKTAYRLIRRDCWEQVTASIRDALAQGSGAVEAVLVSKDGRETPCYFRGLRIVWDGQPCVIGVGIDISERKHAEADLERARLLLEAVLEQSPVSMVMVHAPDHRIGVANRAAREFLGKIDEPDHTAMTLAESQRLQTWRDILPDGTPTPPEKLPLVRTLRGEAFTNVEYGVVRKDGSRRWASVSGTPIRGRDGELIAGLIVFPDITERKRAEEELRRRETELRRQNEVLLHLMQRGTLFGGELDTALAEITAAGAELLQVERVSVWWYEDERRLLRCADAYQRSRGEHSRGETLCSADFPTYNASHLQGQIVAVEDVRTDPRTREFPAAYWEAHDIRSLVDAPVWVHGSLGAVVCCEHAGAQRRWTPDDEQVATTLATLVSLCVESAERGRAEAGLQLNEARLEALLQLNQMTEASLKEITEFAMEEAVRLTRSQLGYLAFVSEDERVLTMFAWSQGAMAACAVQDRPVDYVVAETGLWGEAVRQRRPIITNDYAAPNPWKKGTPAGHVTMQRHMNVPVFDGDRIVLVAGVGNKAWDYDESDVRQLTLLMSGMWRIVQRKRAAEALGERERLLDNIIEQNPYPMWISDARGTLLRINRACCDLLGIDEEELVNRYNILRDEIVRGQGFMPLVESVFAEGRTAHFKLEYDMARAPYARLGPARQITLEVTIAPVKDAAGIVTHAVIMHHDITQRMQAENELRESERKFRELTQEFQSILGAIPGSLVLLSPDLRVVWANEFAATSMGAAPGDILGAHCYRFRHNRAEPCDGCPVLRSFASGRPESTDHATPDGKIWELHAAPVFGDQGEISGVIEIAYEVTEYRRAARELQASEAMLRSVFRAAPIGIMFNVDRKIVSVNAALCALVGYGESEMLGQSARLFYATAEEYEDAGRQLYTPLPEAGHTTFETRLRRKDGSLIDVVLSAALLRPDDPAAGHVVTVHDITQRKSAELALRSRLVAMTRPLDDTTSITFSDLFDVEEIQRLQDAFTESSGTAQLITEPDGTPITRPSGFCRLCAEFIRRSEKGRQRCYLSDSSLGRVCIEGPTIRPCLSAGLWGAGASIMVGGKHIANWLIGQVRNEHLDMEKIARYAAEVDADPEEFRAALEEVPVMSEEQFRKTAHTLFVLSKELSTKAYQNIQQARFIADLKRMEEERARLERQLRQSQKMEAVGQLAGGVAHDFNNILTAVFGQIDLAVRALESQYPEARDVHDSMEQIERSAQRAAALTRQLLAFSRRQVVQPEVLDLNTTLRDLEKMLRRLLTEDIVLEQVLAPDLAAIKADAGQLEQVIVNLVVNARDAMSGGGHLTIGTQNVVLDDAYVALHPEAQPGAHVVLTVSDTGCGMESAILERIFEPFFTTKPVGQGTGLGLPTVYGIVKQAGGHVIVYSEPGRGSSFKIYLPAVEQPLPTATSLRAQPTPTGAETLIVCEDDDLVRDLASQMLTKAGYTVLVASRPEVALELATAHAGPIQLLITDVIMPGMNGRELAEALTRVRPGLRTLFVSGYTSNVIAHHGVLDEHVNFLEKPFGRQRLLQKVREVLDALPQSAARDPHVQAG